MSRSSFVTPLIVEEIDGKHWRLHIQFTYERWCRGSRDKITVPAGFVYDFASFPKFLFIILPLWAKYNKAPVLHDWLYRYGAEDGITRYWADFIFREAMLVAFRHHRSGKVVAYIEWLAVRAFGWLSYKGKVL